jgi:fructokinase
VYSREAANTRYTIYPPAAWDNLETTLGFLEVARRHGAICSGTLAQRGPTSRDTIHKVLAAAGPKCLTVYDINLRQHYYDRDWIEKSLAASKIAKLNHEEVRIIAPLLEAPGDPTEFCRALLERTAVDAVCLTRAEDGCLIVTGDEVIDIPGEKVNVVDAVGSGDAFSAAMIMALCRGWPLAKAARFANRVGALMATKPGATPRIAAEYKQLWGTFESAN